ncbi:hypothetical protein AP058_00251 [Flavobacterium sp. TAB 87]|nr:hypothetical protein AP058_00251 [Flavobacterium sp. TAB 87]
MGNRMQKTNFQEVATASKMTEATIAEFCAELGIQTPF